jgi:hypothetical protein
MNKTEKILAIGALVLFALVLLLVRELNITSTESYAKKSKSSVVKPKPADSLPPGMLQCDPKLPGNCQPSSYYNDHVYWCPKITINSDGTHTNDYYQTSTPCPKGSASPGGANSSTKPSTTASHQVILVGGGQGMSVWFCFFLNLQCGYTSSLPEPNPPKAKNN